MVLGTAAQNEATVERGIFSKVTKFLGKLTFLQDAMAMYYCARDEATPFPVKAALFSALAYFVLPVDLVNDAIPVVGFADDAVLITTTLSMCGSYIKDEHREQARSMIGSLIPGTQRSA